jgi:hypothetical protein
MTIADNENHVLIRYFLIDTRYEKISVIIIGSGSSSCRFYRLQPVIKK